MVPDADTTAPRANDVRARSQTTRPICSTRPLPPRSTHSRVAVAPTPLTTRRPSMTTRPGVVQHPSDEIVAPGATASCLPAGTTSRVPPCTRRLEPETIEPPASRRTSPCCPVEVVSQTVRRLVVPLTVLTGTPRSTAPRTRPPARTISPTPVTAPAPASCAAGPSSRSSPPARARLPSSFRVVSGAVGCAGSKPSPLVETTRTRPPPVISPPRTRIGPPVACRVAPDGTSMVPE